MCKHVVQKIKTLKKTLNEVTEVNNTHYIM
jgi:hypothetical protein